MAKVTKTTSDGGANTAAIGMAANQVLGAYLQAEAVKRQSDIQGKIDEFNAQLAQYDSWKAEAYGQTVMARYQSTIDQSTGTSKVYAASKGIDIKDGSISELNAQNEYSGFLNKIDLDNRSYEQALGYKRQASQIRLGSDMNRLQSNTQANSLITGGVANAAGTLLASKIRNKKYDPSGYGDDTTDIPNNDYNYDLMPE